MFKKVLFSFVCGLAVAACNIDVPDLNNPGLADLKDNPNATVDNTAATGMLIQSRLDIAGEAGLIDLEGILGREAYNFDAADGRYVTELVEGTLNKSDAYGGAFWGNEYRTYALGNIILAGIDNVKDFSTDATKAANAKAAMKAFVETIQALALLTVVTTHDGTGAPLPTSTDPTVLAPFVSQAEVYKKIVALLDDANTILAPLASAQPKPVKFTFPLSAGFAGFNDTAGFKKFNRALRARVAVYTGDYPTALTALQDSFINDTGTPDMTVGVYHSFSLTANDATNGLVNKNIWAHPDLRAKAQKQTNGDPDKRFTNKVTHIDAGGAGGGLSSNDQFIIYSPIAPVTIIRNEDLILLKAEALAETGDLVNATKELNIVHTQSGGLPDLAPITSLGDENSGFIQALLYERQYSLMMEGQRWIDLRRFGIQLGRTLIPTDRPTDSINFRFPVPQVECDARGSEAACNIVPTTPPS